jgi:hypothetical protein
MDGNILTILPVIGLRATFCAQDQRFRKGTAFSDKPTSLRSEETWGSVPVPLKYFVEIFATLLLNLLFFMLATIFFLTAAFLILWEPERVFQTTPSFALFGFG